MKKIILSLMLVLGTTLGAQAQTFDFSCVDSQVTDNGGPIDSFLILSDGFTAAQLASINTSGYVASTVEGVERAAKTFTVAAESIPNANPNYGPTIIPAGPREVSVTVGSFTDGRDDTNVMGPFKYKVLVSGGTYQFIHFFNDVEDVLNFLLAYNEPTDVANYIIYNGDANRIDFHGTTLTGSNGEGVIDVFIQGTPGDTFTGQLTSDFRDDGLDTPTDVTYSSYDSYDYASRSIIGEELLVDGIISIEFPAAGEISSINVIVQSMDSGQVGQYGLTKRYRFVGLTN